MQNNRFIILSTGRAGSTFISKYFQFNYPKLNIEHQKFGSRFINILSNLPFNGKLFTKFLFFILTIFNRTENGFIKSTSDPLLSMEIGRAHV